MFSALEVFYENALYKFTFDIDIDIDMCSIIQKFVAILGIRDRLTAISPVTYCYKPEFGTDVPRYHPSIIAGMLISVTAE